MLPQGNLVSWEWLQENIDQPNVIVLYTQMDNPVTGVSEKSPGNFIANSMFFDFEKVFCDLASDFPHTMPNETSFTDGARRLGINQNSVIVVYDNKGMYCAPRVWWMFKAMGHDNVCVLNGGLPEWLGQNLPTVPQLVLADKQGDFDGKYNDKLFITADNIIQQLTDITLLDARSAGRFNGSQPEPRNGLRSGHIPTSINLPFTECIEDNKLKSTSQLVEIFANCNITADKPLVFSCGSGVTACILALAASEAGFENLAVFDGSWSEWGARLELPVEL